MKKLIVSTIVMCILCANTIFAQTLPFQNISINGVPTGIEVINIKGRNLANSDELLKIIGIDSEITTENNTSITFEGITFKNNSDILTVNGEEFKMNTKPIIRNLISLHPSDQRQKPITNFLFS